MPVVGLSDFKQSDKEGAPPPSTSSDDRNELYTGGATSGLAVVGPSRGTGSTNLPHNQRILRLAKRSKRQNEEGGNASGAKSTTTIITLYKNGFVVGDGKFRSKDDPANQRFLKELAAGNCPRELETGINQGAMVELKDKHTEDYVPPNYVAFGGSGHSLAAPTNASSTAAGPPLESSPDLVAKRISVDDSAPTARVQLQLHDRRRIVVTCNLSTTVKELWQHAAAETPGLKGQFVLLQGFPPKPVPREAMGQTVSAAKLAGAKLTQRRS